MPFFSTSAAVAALATLVSAQSNLGGRGFVDLSIFGGTPDAKGAGILYGLPNDPAYSPETSPPRSTWGSFFQEAGISHVRAGGAQIPFGGYASDVLNGGTTGYDERFASMKKNYQDAKALNPKNKFVLLVHDIWGADSTQGSDTPFPCDNGDCTEYGRYLDKLIGDLKSNDLLEGLQIDIWNEPDGSNFWPGSQDQYLQSYDFAYAKYRAAFGTNVALVAPSTAAQPSLDNSWWNNFTSHISGNGNIPDWWSAHQLNGRNTPNCGNDPVITQQQLRQVLEKYNLPEKPFQINEYAASDEQTPAYTAWFIQRFERTGIVGMRANWGSKVGLHNDIAKLLGPGDQDKSSNFYKLGDWHVLNYYTQAQKGVITLAGATVSTCYDLYVTQERDVGITHVLAGSRGQSGAYPVTISNVDSMPAYKGKTSLRVVVREIPWNNGGVVDEPTTVSNGTVAVADNQLVIGLDMRTDSAYTIDVYAS
ncbi:uncharacterized protein RCC_01801 [Ramularia collo-cygni]|uniref:Beta-xylosidase n=1 Tax=Ramularia collo-cygni TaxID=112498 RepID=A0A2D3UN11_9PEZI|nr:uncharacterized protein RCC_01801 [Ramularia collo-cygni]CZT15961.1 uncharacterized protein RCC_01801 [Ramularia collo-cygni]